MPDVVTAPAAPLTVVARRAYPSPLNGLASLAYAGRSTRLFITQSVNKNYLSYYRQIINAKWKLVSLASVNLAARQFLAIAYFASLVTASDLAALTALYLLRENLYLFPLSDFAEQKTKVI